MTILILTESHIDATISRAEFEIIKRLQADKQFTDLCLEYPEEKSVNSFIGTLEFTISNYENKYIYTAVQALMKRKVNISKQDLTKMELMDLFKLLQTNGYDANNAMETAMGICSYEATCCKLEMVRTLKSKMSIHCVDAPRPKLNYGAYNQFVNNREIQNARDQHISTRLESLARNGKNVVLIIGRMHTPGLIKQLAARGLLNDIYFIHLQTRQSLKLELDLPSDQKQALYTASAKAKARTVTVDSANLARTTERVMDIVCLNEMLAKGNFPNQTSKIGLWLYNRRSAAKDVVYADEIEVLRRLVPTYKS